MLASLAIKLIPDAVMERSRQAADGMWENG